MKNYLLAALFVSFSICALAQDRWTGAMIFTQPDSLRTSAVSVLDEPVCSMQISFYPSQTFPFKSSIQPVWRMTDDPGTLWIHIGIDLTIHLIPNDAEMRWRYSRHLWRGDGEFACYAWVGVAKIEAGEERNLKAGEGILTIRCLPITPPGPRSKEP